MKFTTDQWISKILFEYMVLDDGWRLSKGSDRISCLKRAIKLFRSRYQEDALTIKDVIIAARKLWCPQSRVVKSWYHIHNSSRKAVAGSSFDRAIYGYSRGIASWCNDYRITKSALKALEVDCQGS